MPGRSSGGKGTRKTSKSASLTRRNTFGAQIRELRIARGISTADMAARLGAMGWDLSSSTYAHIESGRRIISDTELLMMLRILRVELGELKVPKPGAR